jgi:hypothetical protein
MHDAENVVFCSLSFKGKGIREMAGASLKCVDLIHPDGTPALGLVPVREPARIQPRLPPDEQAAVLDAATFNRIDYVFFRRFSDRRSSQLAAYVVDNSNQELDESTLANLHSQLWLHGTAPLLYVAWPSRIDVLTCARGPDFWRDGECQFGPAETIRISSQIASELDYEFRQRTARFSALRLADGTFWEDPRNAVLANHEMAAHQSLIQAVVEADQDLNGENQPVMRRLLLLMVLIKYLEDRGVFPDRWFGRFHNGATTFFAVLRGGEPDEVHRLLAALQRKFNGDIFSLPTERNHSLTKTALKRFASLVEARTLQRQAYLWRLFSFEHLPVEIVSHLYQRFVKGGHGAVYTPPFLASLLLDYAMPFDKLTGSERILDPACGSGVFLVGAFRRLVHIWRSNNNWQRPDVATLKRLLRQNIFGIELDSNAVDLAAFSLALAICDALKPTVIWTDLTFNPLRNNNLFEADFFELRLRSGEGAQNVLDHGFDLVLGNPPFESDLTPPGRRLNKHAMSINANRGKLPDNQAAYLFLEQALAVLHPTGRICLIQPSGLLYNSKASAFRRHITANNQIQAVLDFTSIRKLYEADPKTIAITATPGRPVPDHFIDHHTFRRTVSVRNRICFELDHYDRHRVPQAQAESDDFVWRANLLGGGRLLAMSKRLRGMRTFAAYIAEQGWDYGEGFIAAKTGKRTPAPFLTGKPFLPTDALTNSGIDMLRIGTVTETHFRSAYTEHRYSPPLILIKELDALPMAFWDNGFLAYRDKIVGIHSSPDRRAALQGLYQFLVRHHNTYRFCCVLNGTQSLVGKATAILKQDIDALPYPEHPDDLMCSFWEAALRDDVLKYMAVFVRQGQNSELLTKQASKTDLRGYAEMFCKLLGTVYGNLQAAEPLYLNGLVCQPFYFGEQPAVSWLTEPPGEELKRLVYLQNHEQLRTIRVVSFYVKNVVLIIKPDRLRYWIRSTAIRDADETLLDLHEDGF